MSVSVEQLTADVQTLKSKGEKYHADVLAAIAALKASNPAVDLSALDAIVQGMSADADAADAEVNASVPAGSEPVVAVAP